MIPKYIEDWLTIIETMDNQNTYKLAWGRSLIEYVNIHNISDDENYMCVDLLECSQIVLKYYWNQIFFFNLKQVPETGKAVIINEVNKLIELYKVIVESNQPKWFQDGYDVLKDTKEYNKSLNIIKSNLISNPVKYFLNASINGEKKKVALDIYTREGNYVLIKKENVKLLKEYGVVISKLLNFKWTQLLEKYNFVPMLSNKVTAISNGKIERNSLTDYKNQLLKQFKDGKIKDFYTGNDLDINDISVDHVLPWSFMYSDDIWNLVLTSKAYNSKKSNIIPQEKIIELLKERNKEIIDVVDEKYKKDLILEAENNYLDKYYYEFKVSV